MAGMHPARLLRLEWLDSPVGLLAAAADDAGVRLLHFADEPTPDERAAAVRRRLGAEFVLDEHPHLRRLRTELAEYFAGRRRSFEVPLAFAGTDFQNRVWRRLCGIPFGATVSYERLAAEAGAPGACRAAGSANGANPIAIVAPCHRVINKSGALGGYGGGLPRKEFLLGLERRTIAAAA